jgi:hypothetical protein
MTKSEYILLSLCIVIAILSVGCTSNSVNSRESGSSLDSSSNPDLILVESHLQPGSSIEPFAYVVGSIKNNGGKTYSYVQVIITLYDTSGTQVGITTASGNNIAPGDVWNFEAPLTPTQQYQTESYKIKSIRGT